MKEKIKKILTQTCITYTLLITAVYTFGILSANMTWVPTISVVYSLLLFCLLFSAENDILSKAKLKFPIKLVCHCAVTGIMFTAIFSLGNGFIREGGTILPVIIFYLFIYILCAIIYCTYRWLTGVKAPKENTEEQDYSSIFSGKKED